MFGESGTSRTGEVHRYYKCATAKKHKGCKKKTVRKQWLEDLVVNQTMQLVRDDAAMESIIAKVMELQNKENTNIPLYEKQLRDAESGIQNICPAQRKGSVPAGAVPCDVPRWSVCLRIRACPEERKNPLSAPSRCRAGGFLYTPLL